MDYPASPFLFGCIVDHLLSNRDRGTKKDDNQSDKIYVLEIAGCSSMREEALANFDFDKMIKSDDRATTMELIAKTHGYSIGSRMLSGDNAILKGLVSIKLEEEDTLTIGYIYRKNAKLSEYAIRYIKLHEKSREIKG